VRGNLRPHRPGTQNSSFFYTHYSVRILFETAYCRRFLFEPVFVEAAQIILNERSFSKVGWHVKRRIEDVATG
jgi:hypothetical protein